MKYSEVNCLNLLSCKHETDSPDINSQLLCFWKSPLLVNVFSWYYSSFSFTDPEEVVLSFLHAAYVHLPVFISWSAAVWGTERGHKSTKAFQPLYFLQYTKAVLWYCATTNLTTHNFSKCCVSYTSQFSFYVYCGDFPGVKSYLNFSLFVSLSSQAMGLVPFWVFWSFDCKHIISQFTTNLQAHFFFLEGPRLSFP